MQSQVPSKKARVAALTRYVNNGERPPEDLEDAKTDLAAANIAAYIDKVLREAPALRDEQKTALAELLKPARREGGD